MKKPWRQASLIQTPTLLEQREGYRDVKFSEEGFNFDCIVTVVESDKAIVKIMTKLTIPQVLKVILKITE